MLDEILHLAVPGSTSPQPAALAALQRYAERLQYESEFRLAGHVYTMVIDYAGQIGSLDLLPEAYEHYGTCMRELGEERAAMDSYNAGLAAAAGGRDKRAGIRIMIAQANLHRARGRAKAACKTLDPVLVRARALKDAELVMRAAHERGGAALGLHDFVGALVYFAEAFRNCASARHRGRLLNDIAFGLKELGFLDDARDAWLVSYLVTKGDTYSKWAAGINLLCLAYTRRDQVSFDQYRQALERAPMPARLLVGYWREVGHGSLVFGRQDAAMAAYHRASAHAARYGFLNDLQEAKRGLEGQAVEEPEILPSPPKLPAPVQQLLDNVRVLRSLPGLLGRSWLGGSHNARITTWRAPLRTVLKRGRRPRLDTT